MSISRAFKLLAVLKGLIKNEYASASALMGEMHGMPQKIGQHLTLYKSSGLNDYFEQLCVNSKPVEIHVSEILDELGFKYSEYTSAAQASIGQVYKLKSDEGYFAAKIKYPGIEKGIKSDFSFLKILTAPLKLTPLKNNSILSLASYLEQLMLEECDYNREADVQKKFAELFRGDSDIFIPEIVVSNEKVIISEWVDGQTLLERKKLPDNWFVGTLLRLFLSSLKSLAMIHGDPHAGNFLLYEGSGLKRLAVLDYGSVLILDSEQKKMFARLLLGDFSTEKELKEGLAILGVPGETLDAYELILGDIVTILLEPFYYPGDYDFADWRLQYKMNTLLGSRQWEQPLGFSKEMLMFMRALQGLYSYARIGSVKLNWYEETRKYLR